MGLWLGTKTNVLTQLFLAAGDPFTATEQLAKGTIPKVQLVATAVFALVLVITGLVYAFSGSELKRKMKGKWIDVIIAIVVVWGGTMAITWFISFVQQNGFGS